MGLKELFEQEQEALAAEEAKAPKAAAVKKVHKKVRQEIASGQTRSRRREYWEGVYEYHNAAKNSHKFYRVERLPEGNIKVRWGRVGVYGQEKIYPFNVGFAKVDEKIRKGYQKVRDL